MVENNVKTWFQKLGKKIDEQYAFIFAPVIVLAAYIASLVIYGVYPFGEYTVASYDLSAQICPFIEHLFDVLDGKSSLSYSYAIAGGADVVGTFLYFFISPFSFLFLICGDGRVLQATAFVIPLKLITISVAGVWFSKRLFQNIPDPLCIAVGIVYAYCGYTFVANTYINWMDFLIWLPFCAGAFVRLVKTGSFWRFSALLACSVYTCFSIACFSMFTVFPALVLYALLCVEKEKRKNVITKICLAFFTAILAALPVLVPALSAYLKSGRGGGLFDNFWYGFSVLENGALGEFSTEVYLESWGQSLFRKWSYILSDSVFFLLTIVWFVRRGLKDPFAKFMLISGILTLLPTLVDEAMLLMNMGSYMSYALRFGFLNALYFLSGACLALENLCYKPECAYDGSPLPVFIDKKKNDGGRVALNGEDEDLEEGDNPYAERQETQEKALKSARVWTWVFLGVSAIVFGLLIWFISAGNYKKIWENLVKDDSLRSTLSSFSGRFAHSLGGLEVIAPLFGVVVALAIFGVILAKKKKISLQVLSIALVAVVGVQTVFYNNQLIVGNRTHDLRTGAYQELSAQLNEKDDSFFRVKDYGDSFTADIPFTGNSHSFSVFSSVIDKDNFVIYQLFGYMGNGVNSLKSTHANKNAKNEEFGDSFLGNKYYFVPSEKKEEVDSDFQLKKYVKPYMTTDENGNQTQLVSGDYYVYENEIVFPSAYRVQGGNFRFVEPNEGNSAYRRANQQALYAYLKGTTREGLGWEKSKEVTPELIRELSGELWEKSATELKVGAGKITAKVLNAKEGENLFLNFVASKGYRAFVNGKEVELVENDLKFLCVPLEVGDNEVELIYSSPYLKLVLVGAVAGFAGLLATAFVLKKTRILEKCTPLIYGGAILLTTACLAFFFLFPTTVWAVKIIKLLI